MLPDSIRSTLLALGQKLREDKRARMLLCCALALLLLAAGLHLRPEKAQEEAPTQARASPTQESDEARLCALLSAVRGAGKVRVMLTYSEGPQTVFAAAQEQEASQNDREGSRSKERRDPVVVKSDDAQTGLVERTLSPVVQGVAVVCEGGGDPVVRAQIIAAVSALFSLNSNHISVAVMAS